MSLLASDTLGCDLATLARLSVTPLPRAEDAERVLTDLAIYVGIDPMRLVRIMSETPEGKILVDRFHS